MSVTYKDAGVNLEAAEASTKSISALAKSTFNSNVLKNIGLFSGFFELDLKKYSHPVIVSSVDGVGTKLKIAFMMGKHDTVGHDLVNHCVNDIMTSGADPLFFLDYIGTLNLTPENATQIVKGMAEGCKENGCALIGGETAEMPGFYQAGEYDLVGSIVGAVNRQDIIDGSTIKAGDVLLGLPSNGLHTNGYSLARKVILDMGSIDVKEFDNELGDSWGNMLLKVHKSYAQPIKAVRQHKGLAGISHITGGGIEGNTKRLLSDDLGLSINWDSWTAPKEFQLIQKYASISDEEMRRVFNMGIGLIFVVHPESVEEIKSQLEAVGENAVEMGSIIKG